MVTLVALTVPFINKKIICIKMHFLSSIPEIISQRHWSKNLHIHLGK